MRRFWKKDAVLSLKIAEDVYTLAQMIDEKWYMSYFTLFKNEDYWQVDDLKNSNILFTASSVEIVKELGVRRIKEKEVYPLQDIKVPRSHIQPFLNTPENVRKGEFYLKGGKLIQENNINTVLKKQLSVNEDREVILKHEIGTLYTPKQIRARLLFYYLYGQDFSFYKNKMFPNLYPNDLVIKFNKMVKNYNLEF